MGFCCTTTRRPTSERTNEASTTRIDRDQEDQPFQLNPLNVGHLFPPQIHPVQASLADRQRVGTDGSGNAFGFGSGSESSSNYLLIVSNALSLCIRSAFWSSASSTSYPPFSINVMQQLIPQRFSLLHPVCLGLGSSLASTPLQNINQPEIPSYSLLVTTKAPSRQQTAPNVVQEVDGKCHQQSNIKRTSQAG